jgi:hypothetical protein
MSGCCGYWQGNLVRGCRQYLRAAVVCEERNLFNYYMLA